MNILMLTPYLPYPLLSGGQIRTYNLLKNLSRHHRITLFALIKEQAEAAYISHLKPFCSAVKVFKRTKNPWALRNIFLAGFTPYPFLITRNLPRSMKSAIKKELTSQSFDLIHAETFYMMPNIPKTHVPILLVEQTIEYLGYLYYAQTSPHWLLKPLLYLDITKLKYWETHFWKKATHLVTMSEEDKRFISDQLGAASRIDVVANGVDIKRFSQTKRRLPDRPTVLFVGTFKWLPNIDAVEYLVTSIWPGIKAKIPRARLWIVGHSPNQRVLQFATSPDITVTANIEDIRDAYGRAHVLLAPIRSGKGTRYKVLEAMAAGTPVVTTKLGAEGLSVTPGKHLLVGYTGSELIHLTTSLLKSKALQAKLAKSAKQFVSTYYNWRTISADLDKLYRSIGSSR
jgi:glycosyltransferase involved in cell wall biosynthesis